MYVYGCSSKSLRLSRDRAGLVMRVGLGCAGLTSGDVRWDVVWWDVMWCGEVRCGGM